MSTALNVLTKNIPQSLNSVQPFLLRAQEMLSTYPIISYHCCMYALSLAMKHQPRTAETDAFLAELFDHLEVQKTQLRGHEALGSIFNAEEASAAHLREFAYRIFLAAERDDPQLQNVLPIDPEIVKKCVQKYLVSVQLLQVFRGLFLEEETRVFEEPRAAQERQQVDEKSKFAKWRIIELKKGLLSTTAGSSNIDGTAHSNRVCSPSAAPSPAIVPLTAPKTFTPPPVPQQLYDPRTIADCEKFARFAISALHFDDLPTALKNLQAAIDTILPLVQERTE